MIYVFLCLTCGGHVLFHLLGDHPKNPLADQPDESTGRRDLSFSPSNMSMLYIYISFRSLFFSMLQSPDVRKIRDWLEFSWIPNRNIPWISIIQSHLYNIPEIPRCVLHPEIAVGILQIRMRDNQRRKSINVLGRGDVLRLEVRRKKPSRRLFKRGVWDGLWE